MAYITTDLVLHELVSRSSAPSSFGSQLERMRDGRLVGTPDPVRARDEAEAAMLEKAALLRCISDFGQRQEFRSSDKERFRVLDKIQRTSASHPAQGAIALGILRAYQERCTQSQERALVEVYRFIASISPKMVPPPPKDSPDVLEAFRTGKAKRGRALCSEAYADSILALAQHLQVWNRKEKSK